MESSTGSPMGSPATTVTFADVFATIRRRIIPILFIAVLCAGLVLAQSLLKTQSIIARSYTAEATISLVGVDAQSDKNADFTLSEGRMVESARRIVISDAVAGEVRRSFLDADPGLTINAPVPFNSETAQAISTFMVYVDATSSDPEIALAAANETAELAVVALKKNFPNLGSVEVFGQAFLRSGSGTHAAEPGTDPLIEMTANSTTPVTSSLTSSIDTKTLLLSLFVGFFGAAFVFCAYECLNRKIRTTHDAEVLIGVPVLARIVASPTAVALEGETALRELGIIASDAEVLLAESSGKNLAVVSIADGANSTLIAAGLSGQTDLSASDIEVLDCGAFATNPKATTAVAASDGVLLVTREHQATSKQIRQTLRQLQIADTPLLGIALLGKK